MSKKRQLPETPSPKTIPKNSADAFEKASAAVPKVQLAGFVLVESNIFRTPEADTASQEQSQSIEVTGIEMNYEEGGEYLVVAVNYRFSAKKADRDTSECTIACKYVVTYKIDDKDSLSDESASAFAQTNGTFITWPYWREHVLSMTAKMGLKPVLLPLYKI